MEPIINKRVVYLSGGLAEGERDTSLLPNSQGGSVKPKRYETM